MSYEPSTINDPSDDGLTTEQHFQQTIEKLHPYIQRLWAARWKLLIFNSITLTLALAYLFLIAKPYLKAQ